MITVFVEVADEVAEPTDGQLVRGVELRFERPYAVVAVALADGSVKSVPREASRWHGVPVFSARVSSASSPKRTCRC